MNILGTQTLTTKEKVAELFKYLEHNANDLQISVETATCIFDLITKQLRKIYENKPEEETILFFADIHNQICSITSKDQLKDILVVLYYNESSKKHMQTNSQLVLACMKIVIHVTWQQCAKVLGIVILNIEKNVQEILKTAFLTVLEECSLERNITFPDL